jgi:hypothetical protein
VEVEHVAHLILGKSGTAGDTILVFMVLGIHFDTSSCDAGKSASVECAGSER